jgi:hypothetical protein
MLDVYLRPIELPIAIVLAKVCGSDPHPVIAALLGRFLPRLGPLAATQAAFLKAHLLLDVCRRDNARRSVMFGKQTNFQSERLMAKVYLGIMIAGVNTLIVLAAALAFVVI